jgi:hypothetical protein
MRQAEEAEQQAAREAAAQAEEDAAGGEGGEGGAAAGAAAAPQAPEGAARASTVSYEKYQKVQRSLVAYLRGHERAEDDAEEGQGVAAGMRQGDVINWYLNQQEEITSMEALVTERKLVKRIITRLIKVDQVLVVLEQPAADADAADGAADAADERIIGVHPAIDDDF